MKLQLRLQHPPARWLGRCNQQGRNTRVRHLPPPEGGEHGFRHEAERAPNDKNAAIEVY